jgi:hypothetical protein
MTIAMKGRASIRSNPPPNRAVRRTELWTFTPTEKSTLAAVEKAYLEAFEVVDAFDMHKTKAAQGGAFTPQGLTNDALGFAARTSAPKLARARRIIEQAKHEAAARRNKLTLQPADKSDAAGQMRRLWKLDKFAAMSDSERNQYLAKAGDNLDPELQQAFLEAPEHSKLLPSDLERVRERALRAQHGDEAFTELHDLEAGIAIAADVVAAARETIALDVGGVAALDTAAAPYEKMQDAAWLRKFGDEVRSFHVNGNRGYWNPASPEEIENGAFFSTADEWRAAQAGVIPANLKPNGAVK